jgi:hypothetical protein
MRIWEVFICTYMMMKSTSLTKDFFLIRRTWEFESVYILKLPVQCTLHNILISDIVWKFAVASVNCRLKSFKKTTRERQNVHFYTIFEEVCEMKKTMKRFPTGLRGGLERMKSRMMSCASRFISGGRRSSTRT